ncbi:PRANC domain-containing protein [Fusarium pseudocircinatum]|uniref:PRANC domain-containing protein n=1 Tax=Fusarium pseudocircinatum TaxID=56676 RepID=A0A8H5LBZ4_9HYPO|nr:PRANC domain-containing protein [Fusarium pseudocircinatum]
MAHPSNKGFWGNLPPEIQADIIRILPSVGGKCGQLVTVCRAWQMILEPLNFAEISLTVLRLMESRDILFRKRNLIRYIWFRIELKEYDCIQCCNEDPDLWGLDNIDNQLIIDAFEGLFTMLSAWEPRGDLVLDISVYSPSDDKHWFKYLTFHSDTDQAKCPPEYERNDPAHGWIDGRQTTAPTWIATERVFDEIMGEGPFDEPAEMEWWKSLPLVPIVGGVLFRQQTRRRWKPVTLAGMLTRFPNIKELCYEPWRELDMIEIQTDHWTQNLIESFSSTQLCKLTIFENFNESYREKWHRMTRSPCPAVRVPNPAVSQKLARASLHLKTLSASFMVDAGYFFAARQRSWTWDMLTSFALTSSTLTNDASPVDINIMLQSAAAAALKMPSLVTIEIWNGRRRLAMVFRYERARDRQPAIITIRGTWEFELAPAVRRAWDAVAHEEVVVQRSLIDLDKIRSHRDAIRELGLSAEVVRPVSLQQILIENRFQA